jgi:hypothetical protein
MLIIGKAAEILGLSQTGRSRARIALSLSRNKSTKGSRLLECGRTLAWDRRNALRLRLHRCRLRWLDSWRSPRLTWGRLLWGLKFLRLGREERFLLGFLWLDLRFLVKIDAPGCQLYLAIVLPELELHSSNGLRCEARHDDRGIPAVSGKSIVKTWRSLILWSGTGSMSSYTGCWWLGNRTLLIF